MTTLPTMIVEMEELFVVILDELFRNTCVESRESIPPCSEESEEEELIIFPRHMEVMVIGNN